MGGQITMSTSTSQDADQLIAALELLADDNRAVNEKRYLKSPESMRHIGVKVPLIRKEAKAYVKSHKEMSRDELLALSEELWSREIHESRMLAIELLNASPKLLTVEDVALIEQMIDQSHTWAYVDNLSINTMGGLLKRFPEIASTLDQWSEHGNFWLRRAAMLSLLIPLRTGKGDFDRFSRYADMMLDEKEFFIRKAIGWILREVSKKRPELTFEWLKERAHRCAVLTVREGSRNLPEKQHLLLMSACKSGIPVNS